jgi:hypothetical protein
MEINYKEPSLSYSKKLHSISNELRRPYSDFIDSLSQENSQNIDWWVTEVSSRNTMADDLFLQCCHLVLLQRLILGNQEEAVLVNFPGKLVFTIQNYLKKNKNLGNTKILFKDIQKNNKYYGLDPLLDIAHSLFHHVLKAVACFVIPIEKNMILQPITLVDTFIFKDSFKGPTYKDRYFPGLMEALNESEKKKLYFYPTFYGIKNYFKIVREIKMSDQNFLLKESSLKFSDYFFAYSHFLRCKKLKLENLKFFEFDLTAIIRSKIWSYAFRYNTLEALLLYRVASRFKQKTIIIERVIDWFENQVIDHGSNFGFRKSFPEARIIGYQGYISPHFYLGLFPTQIERKSRVLPTEIAVIGKKQIAATKEFDKFLDVKVAPAFRFFRIWQKAENKNSMRQKVFLIALPIHPQESNRLLKMLEDADFNEINNIKFVIKFHPAVKHRTLNLKFKSPNVEWELLNDSLHQSIHQWLNQCSGFVTSSLTPCIEALVKGVPVIVVNNLSGPNLHSIPDSIPRELWQLCCSAEELSDAVKTCTHISSAEKIERIEKGVKIRKGYFEKVTAENIRKFLV